MGDEGWQMEREIESMQTLRSITVRRDMCFECPSDQRCLVTIGVVTIGVVTQVLTEVLPHSFLPFES